MAAVAQQTALQPSAWHAKARPAKVSAARARGMQVFKEFKAYETFSFMPDLTDDEIARQVEYCVSSGWTPCIEFDTQKEGLVDRENMHAMPGYQDGRYWTMWKLPMYGCRHAGEVLEEIAACKREYPHAYVRIIGFDSVRQTQCVSFLVQKPSGGSPSRSQGAARAPARQPARAPAARQVQSMAPPRQAARPSSRPVETRQQSYSPPPPAPAASYSPPAQSQQSYSPPPASYGGSSGGATDFLKELEKRKVAWQEYASIDTKRRQLEQEIQAQRQKMDSLMSQVRSLEAEEGRIEQERASLSSRFPGVDPMEFEQVRRILNM